jgi:hypothetical protein
MMKQFNLDTITILTEERTEFSKMVGSNHYECKVIGKYIGGKRWKRATIILNSQQIREIRLRKLLN